MQIVTATGYCLMPDWRIDGCGLISPNDPADRERVARTVPADRQLAVIANTTNRSRRC